jgi:osmoprotectant transport system permease protein
MRGRPRMSSDRNAGRRGPAPSNQRRGTVTASQNGFARICCRTVTASSRTETTPPAPRGGFRAGCSSGRAGTQTTAQVPRAGHGKGLPGMWDYLIRRRDLVAHEALQHLSLVVQCVLLGSVLAVALTIPSFALLGLLLAPFGFGITPAVLAVTFYAALPVLRNAVVGLAGVDRAMVESARGVGMSRTATLVRVELPMAWPVILAGIRISTQMVMGIAAVAAYVLGPGLGGFIFTGLSRLGGANALNAALTGTIAIVLLALVLDLLLQAAGRLTTPRGIRV